MKNEPAFPVMGINGEDGTAIKGMTLRDYLAGQALPFMMQFDPIDGERTKRFEDVAKCCYDLADAMLTERSKGESDAKR